MKQYAGYGINFTDFWKYYKNSSRVDYSNYSSVFLKCIHASIESAGIYSCSNYVNLVDKKLATICKETRILMLSKGVPDKAARHIIECFKKWLKIYYA